MKKTIIFILLFSLSNYALTQCLHPGGGGVGGFPSNALGGEGRIFLASCSGQLLSFSYSPYVISDYVEVREGQTGEGTLLYANYSPNWQSVNGIPTHFVTSPVDIHQFGVYCILFYRTMGQNGYMIVNWNQGNQNGLLYDSPYPNGAWRLVNNMAMPVGWEIGTFLPTELIDFNAVQAGSSNQLYWQTESEVGNKGFEVQRSPDGTNWEPLQFIEGSGTATTSNHYFFEDKSPFSGSNYYRLKQIDFQGDFTYSSTIFIEFIKERGVFLIYPTASPSIFTVQSDLPVDIKIYDLMGRLCMSLNEFDGLKTVDISMLSVGSYILCGSSNGSIVNTYRFFKT